LVLKWGKQLPHQVEFKVTNKGFDIGGRSFYSYDYLVGFATRQLDEHDEGFSEVILRQKHRLSTYVNLNNRVHLLSGSTAK